MGNIKKNYTSLDLSEDERRYFQDMISIKSEINYFYKRDITDCFIEMEFVDYLQKYVNDFYQEVINNIYNLGSQTEVNGHSDFLDYLKERNYSLLGI